MTVLSQIDAKFNTLKNEAQSAGDLPMATTIGFVHVLARRQALAIETSLTPPAAATNASATVPPAWSQIIAMLVAGLSSLFPAGSTIANLIAMVLALLPSS